MINKPAVNELEDMVGCRYMLVMAVARRARQLMNDPTKLNDRNPVTAAVDDLYHNHLLIDYPEEYTR